jgi:hypothetical protein
MSWTGQIFWLLASGSEVFGTHLLPAFTPEKLSGIGSWEVVSSYSSATAPDLHGISRADPPFQARKELRSTTSGLRFATQDLFINHLKLCLHLIPTPTSSSQVAPALSART